MKMPWIRGAAFGRDMGVRVVRYFSVRRGSPSTAMITHCCGRWMRELLARRWMGRTRAVGIWMLDVDANLFHSFV